MKRTRFFRAYLVDNDQPWWHNRLVIWWGRKPEPKQTPKGVDEGDHPHELRFEWKFGLRTNFRLGVQVGAEDGHDVTFSFGIPWLVSLYVTQSVSRRFTERVLPWYPYNDGGWSLDRELSISTFEKTVWVHLWTHPMDGGYGSYSGKKLPEWRDFNFSINPADLLGRRRCKVEILETERGVLIPMPEGDYCGLLKVERRTWTRKLWPWWPLKLERITRDIECPDGIPFSGKGENSHDCGEDGIYATGFSVSSDEEACAMFAASALQTRRKRHDPRVWPESPGDRAARLATMRNEQEQQPHADASVSKENPE